MNIEVEKYAIYRMVPAGHRTGLIAVVVGFISFSTASVGTRSPRNANVTSHQSIPESIEGDVLRFNLGDERTGMTLRLSVSLFTNFPEQGSLAFAAIGRFNGSRIAGVGLGIVNEGFDMIGSVLSDPLSYLSLDLYWKLDLSFLGEYVPSSGGSVLS